MRAFLALLFLVLLCGCVSPRTPEASGSPEAADRPPSNAETEPVKLPDPLADLDKGNAEIGRAYFFGENRGRCLACHTLAGEGAPGGWALDDTGLRRDPQWLAIFLDNPRNQRPEVARMPPYRGDPEARITDIVAFLMTLKSPVEHPAPSDVKPADEPEVFRGGVGGRRGGGHGGAG